MFGNIPFICEMQDQEAIDIMIAINSHNWNLTRVEAEQILGDAFDKVGITANMLSPRVQRKVNDFLCRYQGE